MYTIDNLPYSIGGVIVSVLASSVLAHGFEPIGSKQRLQYWYLLLLCEARSIKEKEQRLVGSESGYRVGVSIRGLLSTHRPVTTKNTEKYDSIGDKKEKSMCTHKIS